MFAIQIDKSYTFDQIYYCILVQPLQLRQIQNHRHVPKVKTVEQLCILQCYQYYSFRTSRRRLADARDDAFESGQRDTPLNSAAPAAFIPAHRVAHALQWQQVGKRGLLLMSN